MTIAKHLTGIVLACFVGLVGSTALTFASDTSALFKQLAGSWRGSGKLTLTDGSTERLTCRGYYVPKSGGSGLSLAILCNAASRSLEMRGLVQEGGRGVIGNWEERTFNASGQLSGSVTAQRLKMTISGGVEGTITVSLRGRSQSVRITAVGTGFREVTVSLVRG